MVEHHNGIVGVRGSNPLGSTSPEQRNPAPQPGRLPIRRGDRSGTVLKDSRTGVVYQVIRIVASEMKTTSFTLCTLALLGLHSLLAQQPPTAPGTPPAPVRLPLQDMQLNLALPPGPDMPGSIGTVTPGDLSVMMVDTGTGVPVSRPPEIHFDLEFPGGTPEDLVRAIEEAGVGTLNVIIPQDLADTELPAMRVKAVTVPQLFEALTEASRKTVAYSPAQPGLPMPGGYGGMGLQMKETSFGFRTQGTPGATSIWCFFAERPPTTSPPRVAKVVRFYQLAPYLEPDRYTVDDITTAIRTGWRMLGEEDPPTLNFHKDTKLLITLGTDSQLRMIEEVLSQLSPRAVTPSPRSPSAPRPVPQPLPPEAAAPPPAPVPSKP